MVEEPQLVIVSRGPSGSIHVSFRGKEVAAPTVADFRQSVIQATKSFETRLGEISGGYRKL